MLGINQTAIRLGNVAGLTLSGIILTFVDWRGLFYINIPIGIFGTFWAYKRLKEISVLDPSKEMDWAGFATFSIGLTSVLLGITYLSYGAGSFDLGFALLIGGFVFVALFAEVESKVRHPLLDLSLFKIRSFAMGGVAQTDELNCPKRRNSTSRFLLSGRPRVFTASGGTRGTPSGCHVPRVFALGREAF